MFPILLEIPIPGRDEPFLLRSFGVFVAFGFLVASHILTRLVLRYDSIVEREGREATLAKYASITVWVIVGVLLGARAMYVIVEMAKGEWHADSPLDYIAIWKGGIAMYGGFAGAVIGGLWCAKRNALPLLPTFDMGIVAGFVGLGVGRIGCLLVGDDFGSVVPTSLAGLPFPIVLNVPDPLPEHSLFEAANAGKALWATQVWMSLNAFFLAWIGSRILPKRRYYGQVALWLVFLYAVTRGTIEGFRGDELRGVWFGGLLSSSQLIAILTGSVAAYFLFRFRGKRDEELDGAPGRAVQAQAR